MGHDSAEDLLRTMADLIPESTEVAENARSILAIPREELPDRDARDELVRRALAGQDICAYVPASSQKCVVWVRQERPDFEAQFRPIEWTRL